MDFDWDEKKAASNLKKHGISFDEAATVLSVLGAFTVEDPRHNEPRFITIGYSFIGNLLVVVTCERSGNRIRIISARKATRKERGDYEEGI